MLPALSASDLSALLADIPLVARGYFFAEVGSTMDWARDLIRRAGPLADLHGTLVVANHQTAGRGRFSRPWHSPPGRSLLFSLVLMPPDGGAAYERRLAVAAPVAVCDAISEVCALTPRIKYPNDVLLSGRKVAGILIERSGGGAGGPPVYVVGIGVNVNQAADELPPDTRIAPTSLRLQLGKEVAPAILLEAVLRALERAFSHPEQTGRRMALLCETPGRFVTVRTGGETIHGVALAVDPSDGSLRVRLESGVELSVLSGDIEQLDQATGPGGGEG